jgi:membrane-anchored protein YejM (alkaline phosphatase superfamily)
MNEHPRPNTATRIVGVEALVYTYGFNLILMMLLGRSYLASVPAGTSTSGWAGTLLAYVANFAGLALVPFILCLPVVLARRGWLTKTVSVVLFGLLSIFIYVDSTIYSLWRFHFNGMVWNLLTTPGGGDAAIAGNGTIIYAGVTIAIIIAVEIGFAAWALPAWQQRDTAGLMRNRKALGLAGAALAALLILDKANYDIADFRDNIEILRVKQLLPLYQTFTMKRFAGKYFGIKVKLGDRLNFKVGTGSFNYPKAPLRFRADGPRPNILIVPIEGCRFDMLTPDVMPFLSRWSAGNIVFENNYSAGNTTRYGIFGLLYGINGTYWRRALSEHAGPAFIKSLKDLGYNFRCLCSADMNYPELRTTCFADVAGHITDHWDCARVDRDARMTDAFLQFLDQSDGKPFFGFVFYDASHQPYNYPAKDAVFDVNGVTDDINYLKLPHDAAGMTFIKNRYKNSLHYVDSSLERLITGLEQHGVLSNTLVFVMGDHGEEFRELGLFGHNSSFNRYQTKTVMVAHIPGQPAQKITRITSHMDVPATILDYLGVENPPTDHTQGLPMLAAEKRPFVFISSWDTAAIVNSNSVITFGTEAYNADTAVYDENYNLLPHQRDALAARKADLLDALNSMRSFTK